MKIFLDQLVKDAEGAISAEEEAKRKARNRRKSERQAKRPQGRGRKKGKTVPNISKEIPWKESSGDDKKD